MKLKKKICLINLKKQQQKIKNKMENKINNLSKTSVKLYLTRPYIFISFFEKQKIQHHRSSSKI
jgi:hypothetical protein